MLSAMVHGHDDDAVEIGSAALAAASSLDDDRARLYADLVLLSVHEGARAILEALMASRQYEYQSDFARRYVAQGRVEGHAEGQAEGLARAVLTVLAARRIEVPADARARIAACTDLGVLEQWLARAVDARALADVLRDE